MTPEEIEQKIAAEVDRRLGAMVAQIGKDLEERYATKAHVTEQIEKRFQLEVAKMNADILQAAGKIKRNEKLPPNHPFAVIVAMLDDIADIEMQLLEIGLYIVATEQSDGSKEGEAPHDRFQRKMKLSILRTFVGDNEHRRVLDTIEKTDRLGHDAMTGFEKMVEVLGPRPEKKKGDRSQEDEATPPGSH